MITKLFEKALATLKQRGADNAYDKNVGTAQEERSGAQIARVYNAITGQNISEADAFTFLQCLKLVRMENQVRTGRGDLMDTSIDLLSYSALKVEAVLNQNRPAQVAQLLAGDDYDCTTLGELAARSTGTFSYSFPGAMPAATGFMKDPGVFISSGLTKIETGNHAVLSEDKNESTGKC